MNRSQTPSLVGQKRPLRPAPVSILDGMLASGLKHHQQGRLNEAERIYRQVLAIDARHSGALHLLGTLAHQVGRRDVARQLILAAIKIDPAQAAFYSNLGTVLQADGMLEEASAAYQDALDRNPRLAEAQMNLGTVLEAQGKVDKAAARFRSALSLRPDLAEAHMNLGNLLQSQGRLVEALASQERALTLKPELAEACYSRGNVLQAQGRIDEAVAAYRQALELKPGFAEAHTNLGNALQAGRKLDEAVASYEHALALKPDYAEAHYNLGNARQAQQLLAEAAECYQRALALKPNLPEAHYNLGNLRQGLGNLEGAEACFERALNLRPAYAEAHYNLGCVLQQQGRLGTALAEMRTALKIRPEYAQARFGLALAEVQSGDLLRGWQDYEARWESPDHDTPRRTYLQPLWTGERLKAGRLLVWGEQGVGDEIMFAGLIPDAIRTGNAITLECDPRLQPLFARSFPEIEVVASRGVQTGSEDAPAEVAAQMPAGSLPGLFRNSEADFGSASSPYLLADREERDRFRSRYGNDRRLVGLAWHTKNARTGRKRAMALSQLGPLFGLPGIHWVSLQYGDFDELEAQAARAPLVIDRSVDQFANMDRFAAQVASMDLVLTIDNSTAHLAGALGLPVWLMLPHAADWRWLEKRADSPWYPTMRLFRQPQPGAWGAVVDAVLERLESGLE